MPTQDPRPLFRNRYRIPSARKRTWDYGANAAYFITICTRNRVPYFGVIDGVQETQNVASLRVGNAVADAVIDYTRMRTTGVGDVARRCWMAIPDHFPFIRLDAFVVMPDHIHGILIIAKMPADNGADVHWKPNRFGPQSHNIASVIRGFKIGVTTYAQRENIGFAWQKRFHDRIIRTADEYARIRRYIECNPWRGRDAHSP